VAWHEVATLGRSSGLRKTAASQQRETLRNCAVAARGDSRCSARHRGCATLPCLTEHAPAGLRRLLPPIGSARYHLLLSAVSTTSLVGGGLIAGDSLAALSLSILGLIKAMT
jgi:hypothetical protein